MRKKQEPDSSSSPDVKPTSNEPFLRRINVQSAIIKKMLSEMEMPFKTEDDPTQETKTNRLAYEQDEKE
jgi:hypothetical protein